MGWRQVTAQGGGVWRGSKFRIGFIWQFPHSSEEIKAMNMGGGIIFFIATKLGTCCARTEKGANNKICSIRHTPKSFWRMHAVYCACKRPPDFLINSQLGVSGNRVSRNVTINVSNANCHSRWLSFSSFEIFTGVHNHWSRLFCLIAEANTEQQPSTSILPCHISLLPPPISKVCWTF